MNDLAHETLEFFQSLQSVFERACRFGTTRWHGRLAGRQVCLQAAGQGLLPRILPALEQWRSEAAPPDLTICAWDSRSSQTPMPIVLRVFFEHVAAHHWNWLDSRCEVRGFNDERFGCVYRLGPTNILSFLDRQTSQALYWMEDARALPYWEAGSPLQTILNWWATARGMQYVHAAAVGHPQGALLLTGPGGSGKSSTALACLEQGMGYLGDDYCLVSDQEVFNLYATAKLVGEQDLQRFPKLAGWVENPERSQSDKILLNLHRQAPQSLLLRAPLKAVVVPKVAGVGPSRLRRLKGAEALLALAPTTLFQLAGSRQQGMTRMTRMLRQLPCYGLELGADMSEVPPILEGILSALA